MILVTNFKSFPTTWTSSSGVNGSSVKATSYREFAAYRTEPRAVFLVNCDPRLTLELAAGNLLRRHPPPLIYVDAVLRRPSGLKAQIMLPVKRFLFSRVDHYIHYFRDLRAFKEVLGIGPDRSSFVPFKVNLSDRHTLEARTEGEYALCFGRSMRDFDTFFTAMESLPYPGAIAQPNLAELERNGAKFTRQVDELPGNIRLLDDDGSEAAQIRILGGATLVVLPILKTSMVASGISTCLNAMMLGKCVIGSEGPGMSDVFTAGEVLTVPPEDPAALAAAIRLAWENEALRKSTAAAGRAYAVAAGGEQELYSRIIDDVVAWSATRRGRTVPPA
jgi:glycosyltransferase involved in cell wall biosynthesis